MQRQWRLLGVSVLLAILGLSSCGTSDEINRDRFFIQGNEALANSEYDMAVDYYSKALTIDSAFVLAYNNRGVAKIEDGHPYEAIQDYNAALRLKSDYYDALFNRAYAYEQIGKIEYALRDIITVKAAFPDSSYVSFYQGLLEIKLRKYNQGLESFLRAIQLDNGNLEAKVNLATVHFFLGNLDTAKQLLLDILEKQPNEANALNTLSQVYLEETNYQNALIAINQALKVSHSDPYFLNNRGYVYLQMDSLDLALKDINRSIYLNPKNAWAYRNKGVYYLKVKNYDEAVRLLEKTIEKKEFIDEIYAYLGLAYFHQGQVEKACANWKEGEKQSEKQSVLYLNQNCL